MATTLKAFEPPSTIGVKPTLSLPRWVGGLLIAQFAVFMVTLGTLGSAINWPASLREPASVVLPLINQQAGAVALGYTCYLVSALLLVPIALLIGRLLNTQSKSLVLVATGLGVIAGVLKMLGIARWLVLMPSLSQAYLDPNVSPATRDTVGIVYNAFNRYAGGIGENLGVMLFSGMWTALLALIILRSRQLPAWLGWLGLAAAALLLVGLLEVFGLNLGPILTGSGVVWQLWMVAMALVLFFSRSQVFKQQVG